MEIVNKIKEGLHQDNNVYDQPAGTMRDNLNGVITDLGNGFYKWSNIKGTILSFGFAPGDQYMAHCMIKDRLFVICLNNVSNTVLLYEVELALNIGTTTLKWSIGNSAINLSFDTPIRSIFGFYENEETQRIYWNDYNNPPRLINVFSKATYPGLIPVNPKFIEFYPVIDKVYGRIVYTNISQGGSCKAGNYFFAWRYYTNDGYFSDWSYLSNPVSVMKNMPGSTFDDYQEVEGAAPGINTMKMITVWIKDVDFDYENIQVCAFYSSDYNIAEPGVICYDGSITLNPLGAVMINFYGSENHGTVSMDDLVLSSVRMMKVKENVVAKKQNVIACIEERPDLVNVGPSINARIEIGTQALPLDMTGYPGKMTSPSEEKALIGVTNSAIDEIILFTLRRGQWYKAIEEVHYDANPGDPRVIPAGNVFYIETTDNPVHTSGRFGTILLHKKYLLAGGVSGGDINTNYRYEFEDLTGEYYDWKSQRVCRWYRSYPHGETIRLGILFFDKTGRPYFVRRLFNTLEGDGDVHIPIRSPINHMLSLADYQVDGTDGYYNSVMANLKHLKVSDLDLTSILTDNPDIGAFMIVRCPIEHQHLGMGLLLSNRLSGNDVLQSSGFYSEGSNNYNDNYLKCYSFFCPEDMFNFKNFVIQPGDEIENITYLQPYCNDEISNVGAGFVQGPGRKETSENAEFYQKFFIESVQPAPAGTNGSIQATGSFSDYTHPVASVVKYHIDDVDLPINPLDPTKEYKQGSDPDFIGIIGFLGRGFVCPHSVLILDINDNALNIKGPAYQAAVKSSPYALLCSVKRANPVPYGDSSPSSLSNNVYVSTGHFQEITSSVLSDVTSGGQVIFHDIDIWGGDTFVQLFDMKRLSRDEDLGYDYGHSIIFPVETRMNIALRSGNHIAKTRSYDTTNNPNGLRRSVGGTVIEEFNYNDGYSSDDINDRYLPLPFNFKDVNFRPTRIRYSPEKNYGELRDSFRVFYANDYIDVDPNKGDITNVRYKSNRLIYWQPEEVGYIPLQERALTQNSIGQPVQLGVGGLFERYDQLIDRIGNSHQFGLVESPLGYHWYDSRRKIFLSINFGLQISQDSVMKGMDSFHNSNIIDDLDQFDNPLSFDNVILGGCHGGYDPMSKMVFYTYIVPGGATPQRHTIGIHTVLNRFVGRYDIYPGSYFTVKDHLFLTNNLRSSASVHGLGPYCNFFGQQYQALVTLIIKEESNTAKIFDTFEYIGNENIFNSILYENSSQSIEEIVASYYPVLLLNRNYEYLKRRWFGNFPKVARERLSDGYLKITFKMDYPYLVELYDFKTNVRRIY